LEEDLYNADGSLYYIETDTYDERNNLLEEKVIKGNGAFSQKNAYKYDQNNNVILSINYKTEDSIAGITSFDYKNMDSAGNWLMETISHDNKPDYVYERTIEYYK